MTSSRRDFIKRSAAAATAATAASAVGLGPFAREATGAETTLPKLRGATSALESSLVRARPVPLGMVRLTGGPLARAQQVTGKYLLSLDPDRMMAYYRIRAGLEQKAEPYGGWDGGGRNLTGHVAGHHLSAVSLMYAATGDVAFRKRADYLVKEMKEVQDRNGDGYLCALENGRKAFEEVSRGNIRSGGFDLNGLWSPWYTMHKTFAGLRDAYRYTDNATALDIEAKFAGWAEGVLAPLTEAQVQKMLNTEHGGMNEVLAALYADAGDERWLKLSYRFEHHAFTDPLKRHQDDLNGKHANCQIPKLIGSAARYEYTGDADDIMAASFFWDRVTQHHSYATAGHGLAEYFGPSDELGSRVDGRTCESCNVYNMLKLTRRLFSYRPDPFYADFQERALFNHALASLDPDSGRMSYMVPVGRGVQQEYQDMQRSFTCCVGTGMENHALHGYGIYYESADTVWVTQFVPSEARLTLGEARLTMNTTFPDGDQADLLLSLPAPRRFTLAVRRPAWAGDGFAIRVNGESVPVPPAASLRANAAGGRMVDDIRNLPVASAFVDIDRTWHSGDRIELELPRQLELSPTPDEPAVKAIMWGPLAMAGDHGPRVRRDEDDTAERSSVPVLISAGMPASEWIAPSGSLGDYTIKQVATLVTDPSRRMDMPLKPFYRTHQRNYSIYFDVLSQEELDTRVRSLQADQERARKLESATVALVVPGDAEAEQKFGYESDPADRRAGRAHGRRNRSGPGWFSYTLPVESDVPMALVVTYLNELGLPPAGGDFDIMVDGQVVAEFERNAGAKGFYDASYAIPDSLTRGKRQVTVRFETTGRSRITPIFAVRMIRAGN